MTSNMIGVYDCSSDVNIDHAYVQKRRPQLNSPIISKNIQERSNSLSSILSHQLDDGEILTSDFTKKLDAGIPHDAEENGCIYYGYDDTGHQVYRML